MPWKSWNPAPHSVYLPPPAFSCSRPWSRSFLGGLSRLLSLAAFLYWSPSFLGYLDFIGRLGRLHFLKSVVPFAWNWGFWITDNRGFLAYPQPFRSYFQPECFSLDYTQPYACSTKVQLNAGIIQTAGTHAYRTTFPRTQIPPSALYTYCVQASDATTNTGYNRIFGNWAKHSFVSYVRIRYKLLLWSTAVIKTFKTDHSVSQSR